MPRWACEIFFCTTWISHLVRTLYPMVKPNAWSVRPHGPNSICGPLFQNFRPKCTRNPRFLKPPPFWGFGPENSKKGVAWETGGGRFLKPPPFWMVWETSGIWTLHWRAVGLFGRLHRSGLQKCALGWLVAVQGATGEEGVPGNPRLPWERQSCASRLWQTRSRSGCCPWTLRGQLTRMGTPGVAIGSCIDSFVKRTLAGVISTTDGWSPPRGQDRTQGGISSTYVTDKTPVKGCLPCTGKSCEWWSWKRLDMRRGTSSPALTGTSEVSLLPLWWCWAWPMATSPVHCKQPWKIDFRTEQNEWMSASYQYYFRASGLSMLPFSFEALTKLSFIAHAPWVRGGHYMRIEGSGAAADGWWAQKRRVNVAPPCRCRFIFLFIYASKISRGAKTWHELRIRKFSELQSRLRGCIQDNADAPRSLWQTLLIERSSYKYLK